MPVILLLMVFSLIVALGFLAAFLWAVKTGQFDDKYTPSVRILFDEKKETDIREADIKTGKNEMPEKQEHNQNVTFSIEFSEKNK